MLRFPGGGLNGTHPIPAPSLRELLSAAKLRECTPMNVTTQKFQSLYELVCKSLARSNHRTTLPQSALAGCQLPQRGSREGFHHSPDCSLKSGVAGDFHRPYETLMILDFTIHRGTLPQSALRAASSLREGAGNGGGGFPRELFKMHLNWGDGRGGFCMRHKNKNLL